MATEEERKHAYKAFKKRLKLMRLDDHSGLSPGSKTSHIGGITPPPATRPASGMSWWTKGSSRSEGHGIYSLDDEIQPKS